MSRANNTGIVYNRFGTNRLVSNRLHTTRTPVQSNGAKEIGEYVLVAALATAVCGLIEYGLKLLPGNNKQDEVHLYLNTINGYKEVDLRSYGETPLEEED